MARRKRIDCFTIWNKYILFFVCYTKNVINRCFMNFCQCYKYLGRDSSFAAFIVGISSLRKIYCFAHFRLGQICIFTQIFDSLKSHNITKIIIRRTKCSIDFKNNLFYNVDAIWSVGRSFSTFAHYTKLTATENIVANILEGGQKTLYSLNILSPKSESAICTINYV